MAVNLSYSVTIIVPYFNQEALVNKSVKSLLALDYPAEQLKIILVDDGSTDQTGDRLEAFASDSRIQIIRFPLNRGRAAARNAGLAVAASDLIGLLDGDMTVDPDWLNRMIESLTPAVAGIVGDTRLPDGLLPNRLDKYFYSYYRGARQIGEDRPLHFRWFLFNNTIVRKSALDKVGVFDDSFKTYGGEDTDLAIRFYRAFPDGLRFSGKAVACHHHQRTVAEFCATMKAFGRDNLPVLLTRYPECRAALAGDWIRSVRGYLAFNPIIRGLVKLLARISGSPALTRYLVVDSTIAGSRIASPVP